ncbi:MAG: permease [Gammaproteobacteria bacterium]|jgi:putative permease|nr:permease [Gammaproteobacteria bacterium]|tara:strand:+ start:8553 stop:9617 length:1065 start_codon:yes stop_codon:yes gene_type:complete
MIEHLSNIFKRIFNNEETIIFSVIIILSLIAFSLFIEVLTPFIISIIVAYLLVGLQKNIEMYNVSQPLSTIIAFSVFIIVGAAMFTWLIPLLYVQLQSFVLDIPRLFNDFLNFVSTIPAAFPELVDSDQISVFFQAVSSELSSITQNIVKSSISGIQSTITILLYVILFPILVYFFLFDRKNIIEGCLKIIPGDRAMLSQVWSEMDIQLSNYVRGKVLEIFIVGIAAAILFAAFGLNYGALLAVLVGLSVLIPFVGAFSVTIPIVIIGLLQFGLGTEFYLLIGLYLLLQFVDGNLLVPIIFSEAVKLHPIVIILAVFIFGSMFGFWGVFFSIPLATFIKAVWNAWPGISSANEE